MGDFAHGTGRSATVARGAGGSPGAGTPGKQTLNETIVVDPSFEPEAMASLQMLAYILQHPSVRGWGNGAPTRFFPALATVRTAARGEREDGTSLTGAERIGYLDAGMAALQPALRLAQRDPGRQAWVEHEVTPYLAAVRARCMEAQAEDRVRRSLTVGKDVIEPPGDDDPRGQGAVRRPSARSLVKTLAQLDESAIRLGHDAIEHAAHAMMTGHAPHGKRPLGGGLVDIMAALTVVDGLLILTDDELRHELAHAKGFFAGVATYAELLKACIELLGVGIASAGYQMAAIGKLTGNAGAVSTGLGFARMTGMTFANIVAAVELVHGVAVLLDPHASAEARQDAIADVLSGGSWLASRAAAKAAESVASEGAATVLEGAAGFGAAASVAVIVQYAELKFLAHEYLATRVAVTSIAMRAALDDLLQSATLVAEKADALARAGVLKARETDREKAIALAQAEVAFGRELGYAVDALLARCKAMPAAGAGRISETGQLLIEPGASAAIRESFAPLQVLVGTGTSPLAAARNAAAVLDKVRWCMSHAALLATAEDQRKPVVEVEREQAAAPADEHEAE